MNANELLQQMNQLNNVETISTTFS